jgi:hypothetical protein
MMDTDEERKQKRIAQAILQKAMHTVVPEGKITFELLALVVDDVDTLVSLAKYAEY